MPSPCSMCGATSRSCASCAPFRGDTLRHDDGDNRAMLVIQEGAPAVAFGAAAGPTVIKPTIGRRVWYWPSAFDCGKTVDQPSGGVMDADSTQPCDAGVCYVHGDRLVNLTVADHNGFMHRRTSVQLLQEGDEIPVGQAHATWMPYQVGQAKSAAPTT